METLFSTSDVHPRDRFAYWYEVACRQIVLHDSRPVSRPTFHASIEAGVLANTRLILFQNAPLTVNRTARHIARASEDMLFICRQCSGTLTFEQEGRELVLRSGEVTLIDAMLPYKVRCPAESKLLLLKVPREALEARLGRTRCLSLCSMAQSEAAASLTSAYLSLLPERVGQMRSAVQQMVENQVLDLFAAALAGATGERVRISSAHVLAVTKLRAAIEARLTEPALDRDGVAAAAGLSVRYANAVLAREGTSIARLILSRRLDRCRMALEDPAQAHRSVSEIAYGWGFSDMTHFSRRFKEAWGMLPSEYRRAKARPAER
jgi:AraC-like DNA-binding protein